MVGVTKPFGGGGGAIGAGIAQERWWCTVSCKGAFQAAGSHESDGGVKYHAMRRFQAAGSHESDGGVQYHATRRFQAAGSHEIDGGV